MKKILLSPFALLLALFAIAQTPVAYYPFTGNANDAIGILHGTVNGATLTTDRFGNVNSAYSFDGVDDNISTANVATTNTDNWSMAAWVRPSSINQGDGTIVLNGFDNGSTGNGYAMLMSADNLRGLFSGVAFFNSGAVFNINNVWYHTVMVREAGVTKFYINGVQTPGTITFGPAAPSGTLRIGGQDGFRYWNGAIDEVNIYDVALSAAQVLNLFNYAEEVCNGIDDDNDGIIDEDGVCIPTVSIAGKKVTEGNSGSTALKLTVTLSSASASTVTVQYATANKTATAGSNYTAITNSLSFPPGQISKKVTVQILGDVTVEPNEELYVILSNPVNATLTAEDTATVKIKNDDGAAAVVSATSDASAVSNVAVKLSPNPAKNILTITGLRAGKSSIEIAKP